MTLRLLTLLWFISVRLTCWLSRTRMKAIGHTQIVYIMTPDPDLDPRISWSVELPADEWPPCDAWTTGLALGAGGTRVEA